MEVKRLTHLQFTHCQRCGADYLVGINGKDIRDAKTSGGKFQEIPFMAIGNEEIEKAAKLPKEVPCKKCGNLCKVEDSNDKQPD